MKEFFENIVKNLVTYIKTNNLKSMVLGLSGGIDSTVCAVICREVSNRIQDVEFIGVSLPSKTNESAENDIASAIGKGLCDRFITHEINQEYESILKCFQDSLSDNMNPLQKGNLKARIRMMYLYNLASMHRGIVIDTDNLTEHYLGFWTIHGDVGDVNPIGTLWKMEVYELAQWCVDNMVFDDDTNNAIKESITIAPTDGNAVKAGGDLAQIAPGLTYKEVDEVLRNEVCENDYNKFIEKLAEMREKYGEGLVNGIISRFENSKYKRLPAPIVIKSDI